MIVVDDCSCTIWEFLLVDKKELYGFLKDFLAIVD